MFPTVGLGSRYADPQAEHRFSRHEPDAP
jgi:hypothetical protein